MIFQFTPYDLQIRRLNPSLVNRSRVRALIAIKHDDERLGFPVPGFGCLDDRESFKEAKKGSSSRQCICLLEIRSSLLYIRKNSSKSPPSLWCVCIFHYLSVYRIVFNFLYSYVSHIFSLGRESIYWSIFENEHQKCTIMNIKIGVALAKEAKNESNTVTETLHAASKNYTQQFLRIRLKGIRANRGATTSV